ncbi:MAG: hypothetical protein NTZ05_12250 [Chloroflexi bacterium]|nr:hypothetical protein [Chloroflexota bacterium]
MQRLVFVIDRGYRSHVAVVLAEEEQDGRRLLMEHLIADAPSSGSWGDHVNGDNWKLASAVPLIDAEPQVLFLQ